MATQSPKNGIFLAFRKTGTIHLLLYLLFFALLFLQFPLAGSLPGKIDTWFFVIAFQNIQNMVLAFFQGVELGTALFPEKAVFLFGNYSWGAAPFFLVFKWVGLNDIWAYYGFISLVFATNAWAAMRLSAHFIGKNRYAFFSGFTFAASNFAFGNLDNPDTLIFAPALISILFAFEYLNSPKPAKLVWVAILSGFQVYFSPYIYLLHVMFLASLFVWRLASMLQQGLKPVHLFGCILLHLILLFPFLMVYVFGDEMGGAWNPATSLDAVHMAGFHGRDLFRFLDGNWIYPPLEDLGTPNSWLYKTRSAGFGILLLLLSLTGFYYWNQKIAILVILIGYMILAIGPILSVGSFNLPALMYPFYAYLDLHQFFRITIRAFFGVSFLLSFLAAYGLKRSTGISSHAKLLLGISFLLFGLENIPFGFSKYGSEQYLKSDLFQLPKINGKETNVLLNLPSRFYSGAHPDFPSNCQNAEDWDFEVTREYLYMWGQTRHWQHTINGFTGFIPETRIQNQLLINQLNQAGKLKALIGNNKLDLIIYHKWLENSCDSPDVLKTLKESPLLEKVEESESRAVFLVGKTIDAIESNTPGR